MATARSKVWKKLRRKWGKNKTRVEVKLESPWKETNANAGKI
jgi:hypothetical protein